MTISYGSVTIYADHDQEGIKTGDVLGNRFRKVEKRSCEIFAAYKGIFGILNLGVMSPIVIQNGVIYGIFGQFSMQLARFPVQAQPSEVIDSVGYV